MTPYKSIVLIFEIEIVYLKCKYMLTLLEFIDKQDIVWGFINFYGNVSKILPKMQK